MPPKSKKRNNNLTSKKLSNQIVLEKKPKVEISLKNFELIKKKMRKKPEKQVIKFIRKGNFDLNSLDKKEERLIHMAFFFHLPLVVNMLLEAKVEFDCLDDCGRTPAMFLFCQDNPSCIDNVIKCLNLLKVQSDIGFFKKDILNGSLINYSNEFFNKLSSENKVIFEPHWIELQVRIKNEVFCKIKSNEFSVNAQIGRDFKPIHLACFDGDDEMITYLLDERIEKCDVNALSLQEWLTPLMLLFSWNSKNISVEKLTRCANLLVNFKGVDLIKRDKKNRSLVDYLDDFYKVLNENGKKLFDEFFDHVKNKVKFQIISQDSDGEFFALIYDLMVKNEEDEVVDLFGKRIEFRGNFNIDYKNDAGWTMLNLACYFKKPKIIQALVSKGADPNIGSSEKFIPLFSLFFGMENYVFSCFFQAVENFLVSNRIDFFKLNSKNHLIIGFLLILKNNMIFKSANKNHIEMIDLIINKITIRLANQIFEKIEKDEQAVDWLNLTGEPSLNWACYSNDQEKINFLIKKGADVNQANIAGETLLMRIFSEKNIENIDVVDSALSLVNHVKINFLLLSKINYLLIDYFFIYKSNFKGESREKIKLLEKLIYEKTAQQVFEKIQKGDCSWLNFKLLVTGDTFFHLACYVNNDDLVKFFLKKNANINALSNYRCTPLRILLSNFFKYSSVFNCLELMVFSEKIDFLKTNDGEIFELSHLLNFYKKYESGFHENEKVGFKKIIKEADRQTLNQINKIKIEKNDQTQGLLHMACANNKYRMIKALLRRGADVNFLNKKGQTPLMVIFETHHGDFSILKSAEVLLKSKNIDLSKEDQDKKTVHIYFDEYIKSLPKYEEELVLIKNGSSEKMMTEDASQQQKFMKKSQSTCHLNLFFLAGGLKASSSILNNENRAEADKMLNELKFYCGARPKRISKNLDKNKLKEKRPERVVRSQSLLNLKRSKSSFFYQPEESLLKFFEENFNYLKISKLIQEIDGAGNPYAYFDMQYLEKKMSFAQVDQLKKRLKAGLSFGNNSLKQLVGDYEVFIDGIPFKLTHEFYIQNNTKPRIFLFKLGRFWIATVYDENGLHSHAEIESFKQKIKKSFHLNLPEINENQLAVTNGPS